MSSTKRFRDTGQALSLQTPARFVLNALGPDANEWLELEKVTKSELDLIASYYPLVQRVVENHTEHYIQTLLSRAVGQRTKILNSILHQKELAQRLARTSELAIVCSKDSCYRITIASHTINCLDLAKKLAIDQIVGTRRCARFTCSKPFWIVQKHRASFPWTALGDTWSNYAYTALACSAIILLLSIKVVC